MPTHLTGRRPFALLVVSLLAFLTGCTGGPPVGSASPTGGAAATSATTTRTPSKPNIVFVLTDDLSWDLVKFMPQVQQMEKDGLTFDQFIVTDSLCCPSRSSIFTGLYPHDTGVFTNGKNAKGQDDGGYAVFNQRGNEARSFAPALQKAGYRTAFLGKYLNGYEPGGTDGAAPYVPPGWTEWDGAGQAYREFDYDLNENGTVHHYGHDPKDYLTDVVAAKGASFLDASAGADSPFLMEIATFAPHAPSTPAPRDEQAFPGLTAPHDPAYGVATTDAPAWLRGIPALTARNRTNIDEEYAKRVRSVQAVDQMIGLLRAELTAKGLADNTYLVFGSDNGFHMGEHNLRPGKQTAFDTDIKVPLVVVGPHVPAGQHSGTLASNIDLNPTFLQLGGVAVPPAVDGHSLVPLLGGGSSPDGRQAVLVEHHGPDQTVDDPDTPGPMTGNPPTYEALRTATATYVEYADVGREYYDLTADPDELHNLAGTLTTKRLAELHTTLEGLRSCHGGPACEAASRHS